MVPKPLKERWEPLGEAGTKEINEVTMNLHHAMQFIAMLGHHLIKPEANGSHLTASYNADRGELIGKLVLGEVNFRMSIDIVNLSLRLLEENMVIIDEYKLESQRIEIACLWIKSKLARLLPVRGKFKSSLPFSIPPMPLGYKNSFQAMDKHILLEAKKQRANANLLLWYYATKQRNAVPVCIWPHHFDTSTYIPVSFDEKGQLEKSIGIGYAIADKMVPEPYFYISLWCKHGINQEVKPEELSFGRWKMDNWKGAFLPISELSPLSIWEQPEAANLFFTQGIHAASTILKYNRIEKKALLNKLIRRQKEFHSNED